jgi:uncharacterized protein (DUF2267 family)
MLVDAWNDTDQHRLGQYKFAEPDHAHGIGFMAHGEEFMRITRQGITVAPDVSVDEAARNVLAALDHYIRQMVTDKDNEILRLKAKLAAYERTPSND